MRHWLILFFVIISAHFEASAQVRKIELPSKQFAFTLQEDANGQVWLGLSDGGIQGALGYVKDYKFIGVTGTDTLPNGSFHESIKLQNGSLVFAGNIIAKNGKSLMVWINNQKPDTLLIPYALSNPFVNCLSLVNRHEIWIGTASGLLVNNRGKWSFYNERNGLPDSFINAIYQDFRGTVWIGTEKGMASFTDNRFKPVEASARLIKSVTHIFGDKRGYVWCGSRFSSEGVSVYNGQLWDTFSARNGLVDNSSSTFYEDSNGILWVGSCYHRSRGGLSSFDGTRWKNYSFEKELTKPCVDAIISDSRGRIWIGGSLTPRKGKGISIFDGEVWTNLSDKTSLPAERVIKFFIDKAGNIWISSMEGLFIVSPNTF